MAVWGFWRWTGGTGAHTHLLTHTHARTLIHTHTHARTCLHSLTMLPDLSHCRHLTKLSVNRCTSLALLPPLLSNHPKLATLQASHCRRLFRIPSLSGCPSLTFLDVSHCSSLSQLPELSCCPLLQTLLASHCPLMQTTKGTGIESLQGLCVLDLSQCPSLRLPRDLRGCAKLREVVFSHCSLERPAKWNDGVEDDEEEEDEKKENGDRQEVLLLPPSLRSLDLSYSTGLLKVPSSLAGCEDLERLDLAQCSELQSWIVPYTKQRKGEESGSGESSKWRKLKYVDVSWCARLKGPLDLRGAGLLQKEQQQQRQQEEEEEEEEEDVSEQLEELERVLTLVVTGVGRAVLEGWNDESAHTCGKVSIVDWAPMQPTQL